MLRIPSLILCYVVTLVLSIVAVHAQAIDTIKPNPLGTPELREVWRLRGDGEQAYAGSGVIALGDITGDSIANFGIRIGSEWRIYAGGRDSISHTPIWVRSGSSPEVHHFVLGDFWGTGDTSLVMVSYRSGNPNPSYPLHIYRIRNGSVADTPLVVIDPDRSLPTTNIFPDDMVAADLDGDGADELILLTPVQLRNKQHSDIPEIWIYRGGATFGALDTPQVILHDTLSTLGPFLRLAVSDFDKDQHLDLVLGEQGSMGINRLLFWFGNDAGFPWNADHCDRTVILGTDSTPGLGFELTTLDADGDGTLDFWLNGGVKGACFYGSRSGKDVRTRSFTYADAERRFYHPGSFSTASVGPMNDSTGRYDMAAMVDARLLPFSGSPTGPHSTYDATHYNNLGGVHRLVVPVGDATGDGWSDVITASSAWYSDLNIGIAILLAGGPYIPLDPAAGVEWVAVTGERQRAIAVWPQPARDELHIAWRGDLHRQPARFEVHDMTGTLIASGVVTAPMSGEARWDCSTTPRGSYLLTLFDYHNHALATTLCIVQQG